MTPAFSNFDRGPNHDPIEDGFSPCTAKQRNYIEILANDLGLKTAAQRNAHITNIVGTRWKNDIWFLSKTEASQVIDKFKKIKDSLK